MKTLIGLDGRTEEQTVILDAEIATAILLSTGTGYSPATYQGFRFSEKIHTGKLDESGSWEKRILIIERNADKALFAVEYMDDYIGDKWDMAVFANDVTFSRYVR